MSQSDHSKPTGPTQLSLVNSRRLQSLRRQAPPIENEQPAPSKKSHELRHEDAETARLRATVDQRIAEILAQLPAGKRRSLFKIRYGLGLDELEQLPLERVAALLKIGPHRR